MVCTGNICRSPTAEGVLRAKLAAAGLQGLVEVDSAGTQGFHLSEPPDPRAQRHALRRGYDLSRLRARRVEVADFERYDLLLAMDRSHLAWLLDSAPAGSRGRVSLLMSHAPGVPAETEVPDPYFGAASGFDRVLDLVEQACDGLVQTWLREGLVAQGTS
jgi:protein-tyrosine phosphatase